MVIVMRTSHLLVEMIALERKSREVARVMVCSHLLNRLQVAACRMLKQKQNISMRESNQTVELEAGKETQILAEKERPAKPSEQTVDTISACTITTDKYSIEDSRPLGDRPVPILLKQSSGSGDENVVKRATEASEGIDSPCSRDLLLTSATKEGKIMHHQVPGQLSLSTSTFDSIDPLREPRNNKNPPEAIRGTLQQLMASYSNLQNQLSTIVSAPTAKECKRIEASLGRNVEKSIKANFDAMWARFQEENARHEKSERERMQQMATLIATSVNKDTSVMLEKSLKKEISSLGPAVARTTAPTIEKFLSTAVSDSLQKVLGEEVINHLDKSVSSKLEASVARQTQTQFQTSAKQSFQDTFRSSFESPVILEQSCKTIFEQVDGAFHKGMSEYTAAIQQQVLTAHTPLAQTLTEAITSASSMNQGLTSELLDDQRKLLSLFASGSPTSKTTGALQPSNGPVTNLVEVNAPLDPMKELGRLIAEQKFNEAFTMALQRSDVAVVSWLCSQVNSGPFKILLTAPTRQASTESFAKI